MSLNTLVLQTGLPAVDQTISDVVAFTPRLVGAIIVLLIGWVVGRLVYGVISRTVDRLEIDRQVLRTPIGRMLGGSERAVSRAFGTLGAWFVYALAILAATDVLAVELFSTWVSTAVSYLPAFIAGALLIVVGFVVADFLADAIGRTETVTDTKYTDWFADGVRVFLYFVAIVMGLGTMGVDVEILFTFAQAAALGVAAGIALAIGIGFGWGSKDYIAQNIGGWVGSASEPLPAGQPDGGTETDGGEES
jgi:small-conductance mechanosensitive channel